MALFPDELALLQPGEQLQSCSAGELVDHACCLQITYALLGRSPRELLHEKAEAGVGCVSWELTQPPPMGIPSGQVMHHSSCLDLVLDLFDGGDAGTSLCKLLL